MLLDGSTHWEKPAVPSPTPGEDGWFAVPYRQAPSADVEMSAYALMAYVLGEGDDSIPDAVPIVRWLTKQRNGNGGFSSTQVCTKFCFIVLIFVNISSFVPFCNFL